MRRIKTTGSVAAQLTWRPAARRDALQLRPDPRDTQLVCTLVAFYRRDTAHSDRGRRCLPLHRVSPYPATCPLRSHHPQLHVDKQQALRARWPAARTHLPRPLHHERIPPEDHPRPAAPHRPLPRHRDPLQPHGLRARSPPASA
jgi:hypothetical protein